MFVAGAVPLPAPPACPRTQPPTAPAYAQGARVAHDRRKRLRRRMTAEEAQRDTVLELFETFDLDGSGAIDRAEFQLLTEASPTPRADGAPGC